MYAPDIDNRGIRAAESSRPTANPDPPGQADREAQLKLLAEQIAAVERGTVGSDVRRSTGDENVSAGQQADRPAGERSPEQQTAAARAICLRLLTVAPRPRAGLAQALRRKEIPDDIAESVLDRLTQVGLIDDVAYAHSFVRTKHRDRALGRTALRTELRRLGVDEESMAGAVETVDSEAERTRAEELISKRLDAAMAAGSTAARRRLLGLLGRRGYPPDIAIPVVDEAIAGYAEGDNGRQEGWH